jgi:tetratricopeptide (TPR) repeat protein
MNIETKIPPPDANSADRVPERQGNRAYCRGQFDDAITLLTQAIALHAQDRPQNQIYPYSLRARIYRAVGRLDDALGDYAEALRRVKDLAESERWLTVYYYAGCAHLAAGKLQAGLDILNTMIDHLQTDIQGKVLYNAIPENGNRWDNKLALEDLTQAITTKPDERVLYYFRALAKSRLRDWDGALADYTQGLRLSGVDTDAQLKTEKRRSWFSFGRRPAETPPKDRLEEVLKRHQKEMAAQREIAEYKALRIGPPEIDYMEPDTDYAMMNEDKILIYNLDGIIPWQSLGVEPESELRRHLEADGWQYMAVSSVFDDGRKTLEYYFQRRKPSASVG